MQDQWNEQLRCLVCGKIGVATMSLDSTGDTIIVDAIPDGFRSIDNRYGPNFFCDTCDREVNPFGLDAKGLNGVDVATK